MIATAPVPGRPRARLARRVDAGVLCRLPCALVLLAVLAAGCGKKGPPLPPIVRIPAPVEQIAARRVGDAVFVTFTLPARNVDDSAPADLARVELYAVTARTPPQAGRFAQVASRVGSLTLAPVDAPAAEEAAPGGTVTLRDALPAGAAVARPIQPAGAGAPAATNAAADEDTSAPLRRFYAVVAYSGPGVTRGPGAMVAVPMRAPPPPPPRPMATVDAEGVHLAWTPPQTGGDGRVRFNVYRAGDAPEPASAADLPPVPLNVEPLEEAAFAERVPLDGVERCYTVRTVSDAADGRVEGAASVAACVTPVDVFPPAAPRGLSAVALENAISLIWVPNEESDLGGYLVLRGEPGDATLAPLTAVPQRATQFVDRTVVPGRRYVYAVVAVDRREPAPNVSAASNRVEETAR